MGTFHSLERKGSRMTITQTYRWRDADPAHTGLGLEHLVVQTHPQRISARGVVISDAHGVAASYLIECDIDWRFRHACVEIIGGKKIELTFQPPGGWTLDGEPLLGFDEAYEIDFAATPFTNTLPIRRLNLRIGQAASIFVAFIDFPSLDVFIEPQRYTRLSQQTYRFESLDGDFTRDIAVDADGFVVDYPGLFERV